MVDLSHWHESPKRCCRCNRPVTARLQGIDLQDYPAYLQVMDWDKLQYFLFVARHGTLARAGAALHVDATTVSRRVSALEASLGQTLFESARSEARRVGKEGVRRVKSRWAP